MYARWFPIFRPSFRCTIAVLYFSDSSDDAAVAASDLTHKKYNIIPCAYKRPTTHYVYMCRIVGLFSSVLFDSYIIQTVWWRSIRCSQIYKYKYFKQFSNTSHREILSIRLLYYSNALIKYFRNEVSRLQVNRHRVTDGRCTFYSIPQYQLADFKKHMHAHDIMRIVVVWNDNNNYTV